MSALQLLRWQWEGYPRYHQSRFNLLVHIIFVPLFVAGNIGLILALLQGAWLVAVFAVALMFFSIALQGRGHRIEPVAPEPFTSAGNALSRIFLEQWITFPRFVVSGGWARALGESAAP